MDVQIVGIPWYKKDNFKKLRRLFDDGHKLHDTHREWLAAADQLRERLEAQGVRVVRVDIDPHEFASWCQAEGCKLDADARNRYASMIAYRTFAQDRH